MSTITLEQVESLATEIHNSPSTSISGAHISLSAVKIAQIYNTLCEYAAILRERESAKAGVTDEIVKRVAQAAWDTAQADVSCKGNVVDAVRTALEAVAPMLASARVPDASWLAQVIRDSSGSGRLTWGNCLDLGEAIHFAMLAAAPKTEKE